MNLPRLSVRNPVLVNLVMWAVITTGAWSWFHLVREFFPNAEAEQVLVTIAWPGATPEEVEKSITRLVEREVEDVDGIERIEARVFEGLTLVSLELEDDADRDRVLNDVRSEIDKVIPDLPDGAEEPEIVEARPQIPVIGVVVHGEVPERVLHEAVVAIRDDIVDLEAVTEVVVTGFRDREIVVEILPERLETFGVTFEEVGRAVSTTNLDLPGGQLKGPRTNVRVRTVGEEQAAAEIEDIVVRTLPDGSVLRVRDVASVREGFEDRVDRGRFWGRADGRATGRAPASGATSPTARAALVTVFKTPEQDAIRIAQAVKAYVREHPTTAGGALRLTVTTDIARFIEQRLDLLGRNARAGLLLVLLTLAIFLELRIALWVAAGLVVSFTGTFLLMGVFDVTLNFISLFGLIIVLGLIVDDAIVVGENIFSKLRAGLPPKRAAEEGANEVGGPVVAAVLTTCVAFIPLAFIGGRLGTFLSVLPVVVICALGFSLAEAFFILPAHLAHAPGAGRGPIGRAWARFNEAKHAFFERWLPERLEGQLRWHLRWRYATVAASFVLLLGAAGLLVGGVVPFELLQSTDAETVTAKLEMAAGTPEDETIRTLRVVEEIAARQPEVSTAFSVVGSAFSDRGGMAFASDPATVGMLVLELLPAEARQDQGLRASPDLLGALRAATANLPGVKRLSWSGRSGGPGGADIEVLVRGDDLEQVQPAVAWVEEVLGGYTGVDEIFDDLEVGKLEARIHLLPSGRLLGMTTRDLALQLRHALFGIEAQDLQIGEEEVTVRVVLPEASRRTLDDLDRFRIATPTGERVPIEEVARVDTTRGYAGLVRVDGKRAVTITAEVDENVQNVRDLTTRLQDRLADIGTRHPGVAVTFEGQQKETRESMGSLFVGFPAALLAIFSIIAVVFRSYTQPVIVMVVIPFALVGAIVGHWLMGYPFTLLSTIGAVALTGIVVNDGLILVDFANRARREGAPPLEAVVGAAKFRLRPILLTSITTIAGLGPLIVERSFQAQFLIPMAISIVFGLAFATALTLLLLPTFYLIFEDVKGAAAWAWSGRGADGVRVPTAPADPGPLG